MCDTGGDTADIKPCTSVDHPRHLHLQGTADGLAADLGRTGVVRRRQQSGRRVPPGLGPRPIGRRRVGHRPPAQ